MLRNMTFEEIQKTLERMLQVNKDIQIQQLKNQDAITRLTERQDSNDRRIALLTEKIELLTENVSNLNVISQRHENRMSNLYGYQMSAETDRLNIMQNLLEIQRRLNSIENKLDTM